MNKNDLAKAIAEKADLSKSHVGKALDAMLDIIGKSLKKRERITLVGFGTFKVVNRKARAGRNPKTGEKITIAKKSVPKFVPSKNIWIPPHKD